LYSDSLPHQWAGRELHAGPCCQKNSFAQTVRLRRYIICAQHARSVAHSNQIELKSWSYNSKLSLFDFIYWNPNFLTKLQSVSWSFWVRIFCLKLSEIFRAISNARFAYQWLIIQNLSSWTFLLRTHNDCVYIRSIAIVCIFKICFI